MSVPQSAGSEQAAHAAQIHPDAAPPTSEVEVRVAAEASQLSVLRAVTADLAMRADFDVDTIADLRLAVDEACSSLIRLATVGQTLTCRFQGDDRSLRVAASVVSDRPREPRQDTFSWRVLSALVDAVSTSVEPDADTDGGHVVRIDLTKGRTHE
ncbi:ATP-binding protein [Saccharopolyspora sp. MS10]|uniref:ATP-binding protein n=1 Tax=Saccharopolyspora sp. MS10 TaxID=3385973 RepID=UPI0039A33D6E